MSLYDNASGLLLDEGMERTTHVKLPLIRRRRNYLDFYTGEPILEAEDAYGETIFFGDWHLGAEGHAKNPFNAYLDLILKNPRMKVVLTGDYFEYSTKTNHIADDILHIDDQIDLFIKVLKQIKSQVIAILPGNHDHRLTKYTGRRRYLQGFAEQAGINPEEVYVGLPQRGVNIFVDAGPYRYSVYCVHGSTGAWRSKNTQLQRIALARRHTLLAMGHVHTVLWEPQPYFEPTSSGTIEFRLQYWLATGGFLKDASYAETKSYPPSLVGAPVVRFFATQNDLDMWQLPYRSHDLEVPLPDKILNEKGLPQVFRKPDIRPACPDCGSVNIISRGIQWNCKDCGRYFKK